MFSHHDAAHGNECGPGHDQSAVQAVFPAIGPQGNEGAERKGETVVGVSAWEAEAASLLQSPEAGCQHELIVAWANPFHKELYQVVNPLAEEKGKGYAGHGHKSPLPAKTPYQKSHHCNIQRYPHLHRRHEKPEGIQALRTVSVQIKGDAAIPGIDSLKKRGSL